MASFCILVTFQCEAVRRFQTIFGKKKNPLFKFSERDFITQNLLDRYD